ncbi:MAG: hypothetical protein JST19_05215 [Bacteroidetes bacterium]|nr:hypothetical protein [Bacteroidota bacterium]
MKTMLLLLCILSLTVMTVISAVEPADVLRQIISEYSCSKYQIPPFVISNGNRVTVLCCCREFAAQLKAAIARSAVKEIDGLKITFVVGSVEFV